MAEENRKANIRSQTGARMRMGADHVLSVRREKGHMAICRIEEREISYGNLDITRGALEKEADRGIGWSVSLKE